MKKMMLVFLMLLMFLLTTACSGILARVTTTKTPEQCFWGSYTGEKTYSFDKKYFAVQNVENGMIKVTVYLTSSNEAVYEFLPARSLDFWGICWERDAYTIWTQSADIGIYGYELQDCVWKRNESANPPAYIISKWDEDYRDHPELWDTIYMSPTGE